MKKVKDNILIHLFADYPTHSVELILSEIAGAPKYLLDAPEGSLVFFFFAVPTYCDLHWASAHLFSIWSSCALLRVN